MGIVYRSQVLETFSCNHKRKAGVVLEAPKLEAITSAQHRFSFVHYIREFAL